MTQSPAPPLTTQYSLARLQVVPPLPHANVPVSHVPPDEELEDDAPLPEDDELDEPPDEELEELLDELDAPDELLEDEEPGPPELGPDAPPPELLEQARRPSPARATRTSDPSPSFCFMSR